MGLTNKKCEYIHEPCNITKAQRPKWASWESKGQLRAWGTKQHFPRTLTFRSWVSWEISQRKTCHSMTSIRRFTNSHLLWSFIMNLDLDSTNVRLFVFRWMQSECTVLIQLMNNDIKSKNSTNQFWVFNTTLNVPISKGGY